jgi:hypothetical protein
MKKVKIFDIDKCPITGDRNFITYLDLGKIPLVNNLCGSKEESLNVDRFELKVNYFPSSKLSALSCTVDPKVLYSHYSYKSGVSQPYIEHCKDIFNWCKTYAFNWDKNNAILDIGGNDGTLLKTFYSESDKFNINLDCLNVDMSKNLVKESNNRGIRSIQAKWGYKTAKKIDKKFKTIISTNSFQHTKDINDFAKGVKTALAQSGHWILEFPYWNESLRTNQFDQVYHEHAYYYNLHALYMLLAKHGLQIVKITNFPIHGGTLRLTISHLGRYSPSIEVPELIREDNYLTPSEFKNYLDENFYKNWASNINKHIEECKLFLSNLKAQGKTIAGFGAAAKGCVFLNTANIDYNTIDYVIDDTDLKQNKYIPGTGIKITDRKILKTNPPDYILILAHNFTDYIIKSLTPQYKGKFLVLFPEIKTIEI